MENKTGNFKTTKKKGSFNIADAVLIFLVIVLILLVVFIFDPFAFNRARGSDGGLSLRYTVLINGVEGVYADKIQMGDTVFDADTRIALGRVVGIQNDKPHAVLRYRDGEGFMQMYPDSYDLIVEIEADGRFEDKVGYFVGDKRIAVGAQYTLIFPSFAGVANCVSFETN